MEETALRPAKIRLDIYGSGNYDGRTVPFPSSWINDSLSQNLLSLCYEEQRDIEELARLSGIPAYYVEERMENLANRCAVVEPSRGKYRTDFIIYGDRHGKYCEENSENALAAILPSLSGAMEHFFNEASRLSFYRAGKSEDEIRYLCGILAFEALSAKYNRAAYPAIPVNYDGQRWRYVGYAESGKYRRTGIGCQTSLYRFGQSGVCCHNVYALHGFGFRNAMPDTQILVCRQVLSGELSAADEFQLANAVKDGYIQKCGKEFTVTIPAFTTEQKKEFNRLADSCFAPLMPEYIRLTAQFMQDYKKLFPKHLEDDVQRMCHSFFLGFYDTISAYCAGRGLLAAPKKDWVCDVLTDWNV